MKKQIITIMGLCLLAAALPAQIKLNVVGDARIEGVLKLIKGNDNTVIGLNAGSVLTTGSDNTFVGEKAGNLNSTGSDNTFLGNDAGRNTTEGLSNVFVGGDTGESNSTGSANTFVGREAGFSNTSGGGNLAVGASALYNNIDRSDLVAIGNSALFNNGVGATEPFEATRNTAVGAYALYTNTTGANNTAQGTAALAGNTTGNNNTAVGESTLGSNTEGSDNTATGVGALYANTTGANNTAAGSAALNANIAGNNNAAYGAGALYANTAGERNVAAGAFALYSNTTGSGNIGIGAAALYNNTDRTGLVAIGDSALYHNGLGATETIHSTYNTALGSKALFSNTTGYYNAANGSEALLSNTTGHGNTANGSEALLSNTTGYGNTANGTGALYSNTTGSYNTANGYGVLYTNKTGSYNTANGWDANVSAVNLEYATAIGALALTNASDKTVIGRNQPGVVIGGYAAWSNLSDGRFKVGIKENVPGLEFISRLRPVTYWINLDKLQRHITAQMPDSIAARYLPDGEAMAKAREEIRTGFVAQEVEAAAREIGYRFNGVNAPKNPTDNYSIAYSQFVPSLVKATQEQQKEIETLEADNEAQDRKITGLQDENRRLRNELDEIRQLLNRVLEAGGQSATDQTIQLGSARLLQNSPNPFSEASTIAYFVPEGTAKAQLRITDMAGRVLQLETITGQGEGRLQLQAHSLAAGTYAYSLLVDGQVVDTRQMVITK